MAGTLKLEHSLVQLVVVVGKLLQQGVGLTWEWETEEWNEIPALPFQYITISVCKPQIHDFRTGLGTPYQERKNALNHNAAALDYHME